MSQTIDPHDIQALVFSGHTKLPESLALGLTVADRVRAKEQLLALVRTDVAFGIGGGKREKAVQVLLSAEGVKALAGSDAPLAKMDTAFCEGMVTDQRSRALGDLGKNAPQHWAWRDATVHLLLLIYAKDQAALDVERGRLLTALVGGWATQHAIALPFCAPKDNREPFGFRDGISAAQIDTGDGRAPQRAGVELLPPGEVLVGHRPASGIVTEPPPLGVNGSYLVVRQLEQDVENFWKFWLSQGKDETEAVWLAAKSVGRWPNGMPLLPGAAGPGPQPTANEAEILRPLSFDADRKGLGCPFGAHIRRANPREVLEADTAVSLKIVAQHRILRRGRMYGTPAPATWYPKVLERPQLDTGDAQPAEGRGLLFVALCSDISRQFEFIQQTWLNNPKFDDLYDEADPAAAGEGIPSDSRRFSIQAEPLRRRIHEVKRWVTVKAGGYFLLPGRTALEGLLRAE